MLFFIFILFIINFLFYLFIYLFISLFIYLFIYLFLARRDRTADKWIYSPLLYQTELSQVKVNIGLWGSTGIRTQAAGIKNLNHNHLDHGTWKSPA